MPTPRKYATNANRQAAYRARCATSLAAPLPVAPVTPGARRWAVLIGQAHGLLTTVADEMATYWEARSDAWQDSERGDAFTERIEALETVLDQLGDLATGDRP